MDPPSLVTIEEILRGLNLERLMSPPIGITGIENSDSRVLAAMRCILLSIAAWALSLSFAKFRFANNASILKPSILRYCTIYISCEFLSIKHTDYIEYGSAEESEGG